MKEKIKVRIGENDTITLPEKICVSLGINDGDSTEIAYDRYNAVITSTVKRCTLCGTSNNLFILNDGRLHVCHKCASEIRAQLKK